MAAWQFDIRLELNSHLICDSQLLNYLKDLFGDYVLSFNVYFYGDDIRDRIDVVTINQLSEVDFFLVRLYMAKLNTEFIDKVREVIHKFNLKVYNYHEEKLINHEDIELYALRKFNRYNPDYKDPLKLRE